MLSALSLVVSVALYTVFWLSKVMTGRMSEVFVDIGRLQWTRKQRLTKGDMMNERKLIVSGGEDGNGVQGRKMKRLSKICFGILMSLVLGSWIAYFWGVATGNND